MSNAVEWCEKLYPTAEHLYHARKFIRADGSHMLSDAGEDIAELIRTTPSAQEAQKLAGFFPKREDWERAKPQVMEEILRADQ